MKGNQIFLLVTLEKEGFVVEHQYRDRFLSPELFEWQSQNRTTQAGKHGQLIRRHAERGVAVHLFVRKTTSTVHGTTPYTYCGEVDFVDCEGDQPISVRWQLREGLPERLRAVFLE